MASGGGGTSTVNQTTSSIPKEFYPMFQRTLDRGEALSLEPYQAYGQQRTADMSADTATSQNAVRDIYNAGMPGTQEAMDMTRAAGAGAAGITGQGPYQFSEFGYSGPGTFDSSAAQQYMSPFIQNVLDQQKLSAARDFQIANADRNAKAVQAGAFGGSRQAVQQGMAENDLLSRTNQIEAEGLQNAYTDAQKMFEADRAARMTSEQRRAEELGRVQTGQAAENLNRSNLGLDALKFQSSNAAQLSALQQAAQAGDIRAAQLLEASGKAQEARQQAGLDIGYEDYLRQQNYPMERLQQYASILHGSPVANATTTTTSVPTNPYQQALGMGISALGLYNAMG